jgi:uncharacterized coiled-coil protein SlyX
MRFDSMKQHLVVCEGRSPLPKPQSRSQSSKSLSPPTAKPVSGLDFYNQLNKLSLLTRSKGNSSGNNRSRPQLAPSPDRGDAATVRELMYPSTSLTIDVAPSRSPTSASSSYDVCIEEAQQRPSASWPAPGATNSISSLSSPPPPITHARLVEPDVISHNGDANDPEKEANSERSRPSVSSSYRSPSALANSHVAERRSGRRSGSAKTTSAVSRGRSRSSKRDAASNRPTESALQTAAAAPSASEAREVGAATSLASPAAHYAGTFANEIDVCDTRNVPQTREERGQQRGRLSADSAASMSTRASSAQRPTPQLSSFAIRLRGSGGSSTRHQAEENSTEVHLCTDNGGSGRMDGHAKNAASSGLELTVARLSESLRHVQQLVHKQQEQYNALLHAHADLNRQVAAQQGAYSGMMRRYLEQASAIEMVLQRHASQWSSEQTALSDSVAALWTSVSQIQEKLPSHHIESMPVLHAPPPLLLSPQAAHPSLSAPPPQSSATTSFSVVPPSPPPAAPRARELAPAVGPLSSLEASRRPRENASVQQPCTCPPEPAISVQGAASAEESTYYSDIASFTHHDEVVKTFPIASTSTGTAASTRVHVSDVSRGGLHVSSSAVTDVLHASRGVFSHIPTVAYGSATTPPNAVTPPSLFKACTTSSQASLLGESALVHAGHRPTTLPRSSLYSIGPQRQQQQHHHQQQQQHSRASIEDRVMVMLHAKPNVVVQRSPWR